MPVKALGQELIALGFLLVWHSPNSAGKYYCQNLNGRNANAKLHIHRLIFAGKNGITPINYRKKWTSLTSMLCRPELRMHDVRHWVAASLLRSGVGVCVASQIMGHRDQTMLLRRYGHLDACSLQSAQEVRWKISDTLMSPI